MSATDPADRATTLMSRCDKCGWAGAYPHATGVCPSCGIGMDIGNVLSGVADRFQCARHAAGMPA